MKTLRALAWLSACVCVGSAGAMVLSPWRSVHLQIRSSVLVSSVEGGLRLHVWTSPEERANATPPGVGLGPPPRPYEFVWKWRYARKPGSWWLVTVPLWMVVPLSGVPMAAVIARAVARRRVGRCQGCGYDLRGLRAGVVCPECGKKR